MTGGILIAVAGAFLWGMVGVLFSPCHLASIPLIVAYVGGQQTAVQPRNAGWYAGAFTWGCLSPLPPWVSYAPCSGVCSAMSVRHSDSKTTEKPLNNTQASFPSTRARFRLLSLVTIEHTTVPSEIRTRYSVLISPRVIRSTMP